MEDEVKDGVDVGTQRWILNSFRVLNIKEGGSFFIKYPLSLVWIFAHPIAKLGSVWVWGIIIFECRHSNKSTPIKTEDSGTQQPKAPVAPQEPQAEVKADDSMIIG